MPGRTDNSSDASGSVHRQLVFDDRTRSHDRHLAAKHVPQLRHFVETRPPQEPAKRRRTWIAVFRNLEMVLQILFVECRIFSQQILGADAHGAKLETLETATAESDAFVFEQRRTGRFEPNQHARARPGPAPSRSDRPPRRRRPRRVSSPFATVARAVERQL